MADPLWTIDDRVKLKAAILSGVLSVSFGGAGGAPSRTISYQSTAAMWLALEKIDSYLGRVDGVSRTRYATFKSGV